MVPRHLHFDGFCGISGDMILGALVDLGVDCAAIQQRLAGLPIGPFRLRAEPLKRQGIVGTQVHVEVEEEHAHRHLRHVIEIIEAIELPAPVKARAIGAYTRLADAEAHVHGSTREKIHFHEVGAKDAILDVAGAMVGMDLLGAETFSAGPLTVGSGTVQCQHGLMPVPAPATAELLRGIPWHAGPWKAEMATPTGVAILATLLDEPGSGAPADTGDLRIERIGYGGGSRELPGCANFLRLMLGERIEAGGARARHSVIVLETEIDDMNPEVAGYLMERLLELGAFDAQFQSVQMKKNRPGLRLRVLCGPDRERVLIEALLRETSTFGVRRQQVERVCLDRRGENLDTPLGPIQIKVGMLDGRVLKAAPEYESCRRLAIELGLPLSAVYDRARAAIDQRYGDAPVHE